MGFSKEHKSDKGGLTEKGRKYFNNKDGGNLQRPLSSGVNARRVSFAARFAGMDGPMKKPNGEPTRKALALNTNVSSTLTLIVDQVFFNLSFTIIKI